MIDTRFTFVQNGTYGTLVYTMRQGEEISRFDDGMIMNNNISGVLSYAAESNFDGVSLTFNILRGTRLSLLRNRALSGQFMISVLLGIANVLLTAEQYMLNENQFALDEDCIFVDMNTSSVNLVYVPTTGYSGMSYAEFVKSFITNGAFNFGEDASYLMTILNFVNANPNASPDEIKSIMERVQMNAAPSVQNYQAPLAQPVQPSQPAQYTQPAQPAQPVQPAQPSRPAQYAQPTQPVQPVQSVQPVQPVSNQGNIPSKPTKEKSSSEKGGLFSKMFGGHKSQSEPSSDNIVSGMNIPGMNQPAPGGIMAGMNIPGMQPVPQNPAPAKQPPEKKKTFKKNSARASAAPAAVAVQPRPESNPAPIEIETESNEQPLVTVLLNQGNYARGNTECAYLIGNNGERVKIAFSGFTVGKENTPGMGNDYILQNTCVSRHHAMFEIKDGKYYIVDMTSLNGTFVNGMRINSNIGVELKNGDKIAFANVEFKFIIE